MAHAEYGFRVKWKPNMTYAILSPDFINKGTHNEIMARINNYTNTVLQLMQGQRPHGVQMRSCEPAQGAEGDLCIVKKSQIYISICHRWVPIPSCQIMLII